jgi:hypothetical protein
MRVQQQQNSSHTPFWANAAAILRKRIGQESGALEVPSQAAAEHFLLLILFYFILIN